MFREPKLSEKNSSWLPNYGEPEHRFWEEDLEPTFSSKSPDHPHTLFSTVLPFLSLLFTHLLNSSSLCLLLLIAYTPLLRDLFTHLPHCPSKSPDKSSTSSYLNRAKSCVDSLREIKNYRIPMEFKTAVS